MTQKAASPMGSNDQPSNASGPAMPPPPHEATTALKDGLVTGARDVSSEVKHIASDVAGEAKKAAESKLDAGKDFAAEHLGAVAYALRQTGQHLRTEESAITDYVEKAASSVDNVSHYLQTRTLSQLMGDAEGFARREPAIFLGGAFFVGLLGGRFLKSATPAPTPSNGENRRQSAQGAPRKGAGGGNGSRPQLSQGSNRGSESSSKPYYQAPSQTKSSNGDSASNSSATTSPGGSSPSTSPSASTAPKDSASSSAAKTPSTPPRDGKGPGVS
jgi:hypothetical protein